MSEWCKWCGAAKSGEDGDDVLFECGSWHSGSTPEFQWSQCGLNVAVQRIQRALQVLQKAERYDLRPMKNYMGDGMVRDDKNGEWTEAKVLDTVLAILSEDAGSEA